VPTTNQPTIHSFLKALAEVNGCFGSMANERPGGISATQIKVAYYWPVVILYYYYYYYYYYYSAVKTRKLNLEKSL